MRSPKATRLSPEHDVGELDNRVVLACGLAWGAAVIHAQAAIDHRSDSTFYLVLFALIALAQFGWGAAIYRHPSPRWLLAGALFGIAVIGVAVLSRAGVLPLVPAQGNFWQSGLAFSFICHVGPVGGRIVAPIDSIGIADELTLAALVALLLARSRPGRLRRVVGTVAAVGALWLILISSLSIVAAGHAS
jgi:hypothetical protein